MSMTPKNITVALGTNATFTCEGNGKITWKIDGTQIKTEQLVQSFAEQKVYVHLPTPNISTLIMTATERNNFTRMIQCLVNPGFGNGGIAESGPVHLLVYGIRIIACY